MKPFDYKELKVWQKAMELAENIYALVHILPQNETYALSDQMRRLAVSIPSNIAEGRGRNSEKEFLQFLSVARGSLYELSTQLEICQRVGYLNKEHVNKACELVNEVSKMINALYKQVLDCTTSTI